MTNREASQLLRELKTDHRNMASLLMMIEQQADRAFAAEEADFERLSDIMIYMTVYPDAVHHVKEDQLYAELKAVRPDLSKGMSRIGLEHRQIAEQGLELRDTVKQVLAGQFLRRNLVVQHALRYVETLRSHMLWEERDLFRRIETMIRDGHDRLDTATIVNKPDPLFGPAVDRRFGRLLDDIRQTA
ncbi:MAG: hemerythrin domain-containing protein [Gammaproteobacteria bacterium]|nr:hemerythrin domain-containing protein [Gammaproteobacteria bacterium]